MCVSLQLHLSENLLGFYIFCVLSEEKNLHPYARSYFKFRINQSASSIPTAMDEWLKENNYGHYSLIIFHRDKDN